MAEDLYSQGFQAVQPQRRHRGLEEGKDAGGEGKKGRRREAIKGTETERLRDVKM